jgi:hypothetical protein
VRLARSFLLTQRVRRTFRPEESTPVYLAGQAADFGSFFGGGAGADGGDWGAHGGGQNDFGEPDDAVLRAGCGRITLDGVDVTSVPRRELRSRLGMVLQDTWLFGGTIRDNIAYGRPSATEDEILEAARATYVDRFVRSWPVLPC